MYITDLKEAFGRLTIINTKEPALRSILLLSALCIEALVLPVAFSPFSKGQSAPLEKFWRWFLKEKLDD